MNKLNFKFVHNNDCLYAHIDQRSGVTISGTDDDKLQVTGLTPDEVFDLGINDTIYQALDKANEWYENLIEHRNR